MRKLGANQKLKSGIFCVLEFGICRDRTWNPAPGIWNPQRGIQNLLAFLDNLTWGELCCNYLISLIKRLAHFVSESLPFSFCCLLIKATKIYHENERESTWLRCKAMVHTGERRACVMYGMTKTA